MVDLAPAPPPLCWCCCNCELCRSNSLSLPSSSSLRPLSPIPPSHDMLPPPLEPLTSLPTSPTSIEPVNSNHRQHVHKPKNRRPPPAPLSDGTPAPAPPPTPTLPLDGSVKTCLAVDRYEVICDQVVVGGWKGKVARLWCAAHEEEEKNVRTSFWSE